jgi:anaphase-promoting complex subunit 5
MTTPHRVALCALVRTFSDPPEEAAFQLPQEARLQLGVFLADEVKAAHSVREPTLPALLERLEDAVGDAGTALGQARGACCVWHARVCALERALRAPGSSVVGLRCVRAAALREGGAGVRCVSRSRLTRVRPLRSRFLSAARSTWWRRWRASCAWMTCTPSSARCQRCAALPHLRTTRASRHHPWTLKLVRSPRARALSPLATRQVLDTSADVPVTPASMMLDWEPTCVAMSSPLGLFVRQCLLGFDELPFEAACRLHARIFTYRVGVTSVGGEHFRRADAGAAEAAESDSDVSFELSGEDAGSSEEDGAPGFRGFGGGAGGARAHGAGGSGLPHRPAPRGAAAAAVAAAPGDARPAAALESWLSSRAAALDRVPGVAPAGELDAALRELGALAPDAPGAHLLRFAAAAASGDAPAAEEALHTFFDHLPPAPPGGGDGGFGAPRGVLAPRLRGEDADALAAPVGGPLRGARAPAALLTLAGMHAANGHTGPALGALEETFRAAQAAGDDAALAAALGVLCQVMMRTPGGGGDAGALNAAAAAPSSGGAAAAAHAALLALLARCGARGAELRLPALAAFAQVSAAQVRLRAGGGGPEDASAAARAAAHTAYDAALAAVATPPGGAPAAAVTGTNAATAAAAAAAATADQLYPRSGGGGATAPAAAAAAAAAAAGRAAAAAGLLCAAAWEARGCSALAAAHTRAFLATHGDTAPSADVCLAYARLAAHAASREGPLAAAAVLAAARARFPLAASAPPALRGAAVALAHAAALARGELRLAADLDAELAALAPPLRSLDADVHATAAAAAGATALARGDLPAAAAAGDAVAAAAAAAGLAPARVRGMLLHAAACTAGGAPLEALPHALAAAALAARLRLDGLHAEAVVALAEVRVAEGSDHNALAAAAELADILPAVLAGGSLALQGRCQVALARATLATRTPNELRADPQAVLAPLRRAAAAFFAAHDAPRAAQAAHLRALAAHAAGDVAERDAAAAEALAAQAGPPHIPGGLAALFGLHHLAGGAMPIAARVGQAA